MQHGEAAPHNAPQTYRQDGLEGVTQRTQVTRCAETARLGRGDSSKLPGQSQPFERELARLRSSLRVRSLSPSRCRSPHPRIVSIRRSKQRAARDLDADSPSPRTLSISLADTQRAREILRARLAMRVAITWPKGSPTVSLRRVSPPDLGWNRRADAPQRGTPCSVRPRQGRQRPVQRQCLPNPCG